MTPGRLRAPDRHTGSVTTKNGLRVRTTRYDPQESPTVSQSLWCDVNDPETNVKGQIGHSFSAKDLNRQHFEQTQQVAVPTGNSYGHTTYQARDEITVEMDMCGYHAGKQNMFQAAPNSIEAAEAEAVESEAEMWKAKYEAERIRRSVN